MSDCEPPADPLPTSDAPPTPRRRRYLWTLLILGSIGIILLLWWRFHPQSKPKPLDDEDDDTVAAAVNPGFAGIEACAECHAQRVQDFKATRHFHACTPAALTNAAGFAPGKGFHPTRELGTSFEMARSGDELTATGVRPTPVGEERIRYHIGLAYGTAGTRDEMYFAWQDDRLVQLPVAWLYPQSRWGNIEDRIQGREVPPTCLECHNTWVSHVPGTLNQYNRDGMLLGVTCERCHGPGREHVDYHHAHTADKQAHAVVHPGRLDRERLMDVCAQCHSNVRRRGEPFSYRPGQPLEGSFRTVQTRFVEDDIVGNQVRSLRASQCFQKSDMTCVTCHDPHHAPRPERVRDACLDCHKAVDCKEQPRLPAAVRGDCVGCHMPARVWMNVHFHTTDDQYMPVAPRTDHRIGTYPEARQAVVLSWLRTQNDANSRAEADRLGDELASFWLKEADQRQRDGRLKAVIGATREAVQARPDDATRRRLREAITRQTEFDALRKKVDLRRPDAAIDVLKTLLEIRPAYAAGHAQMGAAYARLGKHDEAVTHLEAVGVHDPNDASGLILLAWMAYVDGRPEEAVALSAKAEEREPGSATAHYQWGLALLKLERWGEAMAHLERALTLQPKHAGASRGLSEVLLHQGQIDEAIRHARRAVRGTESDNAEMLVTLARAYAAAQRSAEARRTLEDALAVAQRNNPELVSSIRAELQRLE